MRCLRDLEGLMDLGIKDSISRSNILKLCISINRLLTFYAPRKPIHEIM